MTFHVIHYKIIQKYFHKIVQLFFECFGASFLICWRSIFNSKRHHLPRKSPRFSKILVESAAENVESSSCVPTCLSHAREQSDGRRDIHPLLFRGTPKEGKAAAAATQTLFTIQLPIRQVFRRRYLD
jgi:hypothetical protein